MKSKIFVSLVLYNSVENHGINVVSKAIQSILNQDFFTLGSNLHLLISDNASTDNALLDLPQIFHEQDIEYLKHEYNLGFAGAHNIAAKKFLESGYDYFLLYNPDVRVEKSCFGRLIRAIELSEQFGFATPKLYRADESLNPHSEKILDAAGMYITDSLRHFDRGSNEKEVENFNRECLVFGGTGACLLMKKEFVRSVALEESNCLELQKIYPKICEKISEMHPFLDNAFFAYREDADLAWRAQLLGWKCIYVPSAIGYHKRVVLPENRSDLDEEINSMSVRNRFLLQLNNWSPKFSFFSILKGFILRNLLVILAISIKETSSIPALIDAVKLSKRAVKRRKELFLRASKKDLINFSYWFKNQTKEIKK